MTSKPIFYCTRAKLYSRLVEAGQTPVGQMPNYYIPTLTVWMFERTKEVQEIVDDFYNRLDK